MQPPILADNRCPDAVVWRATDPCCGSGVVFDVSSNFVTTQVLPAGTSHSIAGLTR